LSEVADVVERRPFVDADVEGSWLVLAAATAEVNRAVRRAADLRRVFVIAVDDIESCTAIGAAQLRRGGLTLAISSDGRAPALVALLRRALDRVIPEDVAQWVELAERSRGTWKAARVPIEERRPLLLRALNALYEGSETAA
jgi:siroheme synthase-like protein